MEIQTSVIWMTYFWHIRTQILVCWWLPLWKCIYILWNRLDRTCYKCIIRLHDYVPYEALKSTLLCLGFCHNSHKLCLKIDMIIINKCCIAHWTVLIHISMYFVRFSVLVLFFIKVLQGLRLFLFSNLCLGTILVQ